MVYSTICASQLRKKVQEMFWNPFRKFGKSMDFHDFHGFSSFWLFLADFSLSGNLSGFRHENQPKTMGNHCFLSKNCLNVLKNIYKHVRILFVCTGNSENNIFDIFQKKTKNGPFSQNSVIFSLVPYFKQ